jgi:hypothetical protein
MTADAVVRELHSDRLTITRHPVEYGAQISDHAYREPAQLALVYGWTLGSPQNTEEDTQFLVRIYEQLIALQRSAQLFDIYTGKRYYQNMLMEECDLETDYWTENSLSVNIKCSEIILANTATVTIPDASLQKMPNLTSDLTNRGQQQLVTSSFAPVDSELAGLP